jgi:hypothetical protein
VTTEEKKQETKYKQEGKKKETAIENPQNKND